MIYANLDYKLDAEITKAPTGLNWNRSRIFTEYLVYLYSNMINYFNLITRNRPPC